jgi:hypothetical protein
MDTLTSLFFNFTLHPLDWAVILAYLIGIVLLGHLVRSLHEKYDGFFLAANGPSGTSGKDPIAAAWKSTPRQRSPKNSS